MAIINGISIPLPSDEGMIQRDGKAHDGDSASGNSLDGTIDFSTTASSGLFVVLHSKCTRGTVEVPLTRSQVVGSLRPHAPLSGWLLKNRSSRFCRSGVSEAMVPDLDQATALSHVSEHTTEGTEQKLMRTHTGSTPDF